MASAVTAQQLQCASCGGTYTPIQADGIAYFHACSPLGVDPNGGTIERPNKRDENMAMTRSGKLLGIKAAGDGVKAVKGQSLQDHPFLVKLLKQLEDEENA